MNMIRALWAYRGFIVGSVKREFQIKYRNSLLGAAWNINSLSMIVVPCSFISKLIGDICPSPEWHRRGL